MCHTSSHPHFRVFQLLSHGLFYNHCLISRLLQFLQNWAAVTWLLFLVQCMCNLDWLVSALHIWAVTRFLTEPWGQNSSIHHATCNGQDIIILCSLTVGLQDVVLSATWILCIAWLSATVFYTSCYSYGFPTICHIISTCCHNSDKAPSFHLSHTHFPSFHCHILQPSAICVICLVNNNIMISG
jgi:hypothetical protein